MRRKTTPCTPHQSWKIISRGLLPLAHECLIVFTAGTEVKEVTSCDAGKDEPEKKIICLGSSAWLHVLKILIEMLWAHPREMMPSVWPGWLERFCLPKLSEGKRRSSNPGVCWNKDAFERIIFQLIGNIPRCLCVPSTGCLAAAVISMGNWNRPSLD